MLKIRLTLWIVVCIAFATACVNSNETGEFHPIDASGWQYGDTLTYRLESPDSMWHGDIAIVVRHSASYPYSNLWLELSYPPTDSIGADSINIVLADDLGNWYGRGLGLSYQHIDTVIRNISLTAPAELSLRHIMRNDRLTDIEQIGIIFTSTERAAE